MNSQTLPFADFCTVAASWPTAHVHEESPEKRACCALHQVVPCGQDGSPGCLGLSHGSHLSVRALYESDIYYCHAEVGSRVIDFEFFSNVIVMPESFRRFAFHRTFRFRKRYMGGFPIDVSVYGAGFCYLHLFEATIRSRVARCLGPLPLLADVVRMFAFGYARSLRGIVVSCLPSGAYHVHCVRDGPDLGFCACFQLLLDILAVDSHVRVGGDVDGDVLSEFHLASLRRELRAVVKAKGPSVGSRIIVCSGPAPVGMVGMYDSIVYATSGNLGLIDLLGADRVAGLCRWFTDRGFTLSTAAENDFAIVTCVASFFASDMATLKRAGKVWAILGDSIIRTVMAAFVVASAGEPSDFASMSASATNHNLARILIASGLREHCSVDGLAVDSKGNADMLEAIVGVASCHFPQFEVHRLLTVLGLVPGASLLRTTLLGGLVGDDGKAIVLSMNSQQHAAAMRLVELKLI